MCMLLVYTLLNVVSHDVIVLSMSIMGFQKQLDRGVGGWGEHYPVLILIFFLLMFNIANPLSEVHDNVSQA